jgi:dipeptidyl aminopeptidase/acylaminoacyl peptidase
MGPPFLLEPADPSTSIITISAQRGCDWSPDGTKILFHGQPFSLKGVERRDLEGSGLQKVEAKLDEEVYVVNADGGSRTALTSNSASDVEPDWSPDGTKITFASNRDGDFEIYTMDADGSDVTQVTENSGVDDVDPDWQPLPEAKKAKPERQEEQRHQNQQQQPQQGSKSRSVTVHQPDTGGPSLLMVASALLFSGGVLFYAGLKRKM